MHLALYTMLDKALSKFHGFPDGGHASNGRDVLGKYDMSGCIPSDNHNRYQDGRIPTRQQIHHVMDRPSWTHQAQPNYQHLEYVVTADPTLSAQPVRLRLVGPLLACWCAY